MINPKPNQDSIGAVVSGLLSTMHHRLLFFLLSISMYSLIWADDQPNLVVILTDQHSIRTIGSYRELLSHDQAFVWGDGIKVETPNIDSLARDGALLTNFYASSPVCTPSRASFLSGLYPWASGAWTNHVPMHKNTTTFGDVLMGNGYKTGYVGKWHLDGEPKPGFDIDRDYGFQFNKYRYNRGHWKFFEDAADGTVNVYDYSHKDKFEGRMETHFATDFLVNRGLEFIQESVDEGKPFAMMFSIPDPHGPHEVRPPYDTMYDHFDFEIPMTAVAAFERNPARPLYTYEYRMEVELPDVPEYLDEVRNNEKRLSWLRKYYGMIKLIDDNVGKVLDYLKDNDLYNNTIVVFAADHGELANEHGKDGKDEPYITSASAPFIIRYPGMIKPGKVVKSAYSMVDFFPTIINLMNAINEGNSDIMSSLPGIDASPELLNDQMVTSMSNIRYMTAAKKSRKWAAAFNSRYKLLFAHDGETPWLFDIVSDPDELINYINDPAYTDVLQELKDSLIDAMFKYNLQLVDNENGSMLDPPICQDSRNQLVGEPTKTCKQMTVSDCDREIIREQCPVKCSACCGDSPGKVLMNKQLLSCEEIVPSEHCATRSIKMFCPKRCGECSNVQNCTEYLSNKYVERIANNADGTEEVFIKSCRWLSQKDESYISDACQLPDLEHGEYRGIKSACPNTCGVCAGDPDCSESPKSKFVRKITIGEDGFPIVKYGTCKRLLKLTDPPSSEICMQGGIDSAKDICKVTCGTCSQVENCSEYPKSKFVRKITIGDDGEPTKIKYGTCRKLLKLTDPPSSNICTKDMAYGGVGSAKDVCRVTCGTCDTS